MTIHIDPQALQILDHKDRLLQERLKQVMAKQYDLLQEESEIRSKLQLNENHRFNLMKQN